MNHENLIRRAAIEGDLRSVREQIEGRSILVTGAAGSIGTLLTEALPEPMEVNAWACRLANYVQQRDVAGAIELVHEVLTSYSPSDTILSIGAPAIEKARS